MSKPLSLNSITFSDSKGNAVITEDYYITFSGDEAMEKFIQDRYRYWKELLTMDLVIAQDSCETLVELDVRKTLRLLCKCFKVDYKGARSKSRETKYVEVRRFTMVICRKRSTNLSVIGKSLGLDHSNIVHHLHKFDSLFETEQNVRDDFKKAEDYIVKYMK